jgi:hypothetical protein
MDLKCRPVIWKHDQATDHSEKNAIKYLVEPLPNAIFAESNATVKDGAMKS